MNAIIIKTTFHIAFCLFCLLGIFFFSKNVEAQDKNFVGASGSYPLASCKAWNGTVTAISGQNSASASMSGIVTKADVQEYCERDPGGETKQYGGKLTVSQCVNNYLRTAKYDKYFTQANCLTGVLQFFNGQRITNIKFPLSINADKSCASGNPPIIQQFQMLCPLSAKKGNVN